MERRGEAFHYLPSPFRMAFHLLRGGEERKEKEKEKQGE